MNITTVKPGSRFWINGLDDLGGDGPGAMYVAGEVEVLDKPIVIVDGSPAASRRGAAFAKQYAKELGQAGVVVAGDFENDQARQAVLAAAREGHPALFFIRDDMSKLGDFHPTTMALFERGGAVVSFQDGSEPPLSAEMFHAAIAAAGTVVLVPEADESTRAQEVARSGLVLGRGVAVLQPLNENSRLYEGSVALSSERSVTVVASSRELIQLMGPAPETANDRLLRELDHLEFSGRVAMLRNGDLIDVDTERALQDMALASADLAEFQARMHYGGARILGATEHRYLMSALETPEGGRPETWAEAEAYVRAYGVDQYSSTAPIQQIGRDRNHTATRNLAM